jgi:hypothetical protein
MGFKKPRKPGLAETTKKKNLNFQNGNKGVAMRETV